MNQAIERLKTVPLIKEGYKFFRRNCCRGGWCSYGYQMSNEYQKAQELLDGSLSIVDLGCGENPHPKASVAVDKYIEPIHRTYGSGGNIDITMLEEKGYKFVEADFENLPFEDKQFDIAYSHHVVEHLENPIAACKEMQRIASKGIIICPSIFAEKIFGRVYHRWEILYRNNLLIFIEKKDSRLYFGEGPQTHNGKKIITPKSNPFDILLNAGNWHSKKILYYPRLSNMLREYWYSHDELMENVFIWTQSFEVMVIWKDGTVERS